MFAYFLYMKNTRVENANDDIEYERKGCLFYAVLWSVMYY